MSEERKNRINQIQKELGYSSDGKFADDIGITRSNFSQMMRGNRPIGDGVLNKICLRLNINTKWLVYGIGDMVNNEKQRLPDINRRIKMIVNAFCEGNEVEFSTKIDDVRGIALFNIENGKYASPDYDLLSKIFEAFPQVRKSYILHGEGSFTNIVTAHDNPAIEERAGWMLDKLHEDIKQLREENRRLIEEMAILRYQLAQAKVD